MTCKDIMNVIEKLAPTNIAEDYDNVGLLVGDEKKEVKKIMIALDASKSVISMAVKENVDMLITHHPMIFRGIKTVKSTDFLGDKILNLAKLDIAYYACHTNIDNAIMSKVASDKMGLKELYYVEPVGVKESDSETKFGTGRVGILDKTMSLQEFALKVKKDLRIENIRVVGDLKKEIKKVACIPGSGKSFLKEVLLSKADVFLTGDIDHHLAMDILDMDFCIIDGGHFETEKFFKDYMKEYLDSKLDDVEYIIANEEGPFIYM